MLLPKEIRKRKDGIGINIQWSDGHSSEFSAFHLRDECHCAACRHELTGEKILSMDSIPKDISVLKATMIGNYALGFSFSDGHSTGIYTFENLRKACPCCVSLNPAR